MQSAQNLPQSSVLKSPDEAKKEKIEKITKELGIKSSKQPDYKRYTISAFFLIVLLAIVATIAMVTTNPQKNRQNNSETTNTQTKLSSKLKICPSNWEYRINPETKQREEYFVIGETKKEIDRYDINWIKLNCPVNKPVEVY